MDPVRERLASVRTITWLALQARENLRSAFGALEPFGWPKRSPRHVPDNAVHDKN